MTSFGLHDKLGYFTKSTVEMLSANPLGALSATDFVPKIWFQKRIMLLDADECVPPGPLLIHSFCPVTVGSSGAHWQHSCRFAISEKESVFSDEIRSLQRS